MKTQTHVEPETRHILPFLAWTFGISWSAWLASAFLRIPIISQVLTIAGVFGPAIGAKLVLGKSFKELLASIGSARKRTWVHLLILTILYTLSIVFWSPLLPGFSLLRIALLFLMTTFLTGGNEEIGWQGFPAANSGKASALSLSNCNNWVNLGCLASAPLLYPRQQSGRDFFSSLYCRLPARPFLAGGSLQGQSVHPLLCSFPRGHQYHW